MQASINAKFVQVGVFLSLSAGVPALADPFSALRDPRDNWLDVSSFLLERQYSFLPVPIIITEPALDEGLGMAGAFFHKPESPPEPGEFVQPSVTAVAAAYTGNESWFAGGGHRGIWRDDTLHYQGWAGYGSINIDYYGGAGGLLQNGVEFNNEGFLLSQELLARIGGSNWWIGGNYEFSQLDVSFDLSEIASILPVFEGEFDNSALGVAVEYDNRDSIFTANNGHFFRVNTQRYDEAIGGDFDFTKYDARYRGFRAFGNVVAGLRLDGTAIEGDAPFYSEPYIKMRGIPANRYQGETVAVVETEWRWDFHPRISAIGFVGAGRAATASSDLGDAPTEEAYGAGLRYLLARKMGLRAGFDIARGPEDTVFYITVGQAWSF